MSHPNCGCQRETDPADDARFIVALERWERYCQLNGAPATLVRYNLC